MVGELFWLFAAFEYLVVLAFFFTSLFFCVNDREPEWSSIISPPPAITSQLDDEAVETFSQEQQFSCRRSTTWFIGIALRSVISLRIRARGS